MFGVSSRSTVTNPTSIACPNFDPKNSLVKCSPALTKHLSGARFGHGDGYTSLLGAASKSNPGTDGKIKLVITEETGWINKNLHLMVMGTKYTVPRGILEGCISGCGVGQNGHITLQVQRDSSNNVTGYTVLDKNAKPKFTLAINNGTFDLRMHNQQLLPALILPDDRRYRGDMMYGKRDGQGRLSYTLGGYEGTFKDDKMHGQGTLFFPGGRYEGTFKDDKMHGQGTFTCRNGNKYEGAYKDGEKHGQGRYTHISGWEYVGAFKDGKICPNDNSVVTYKNVRYNIVLDPNGKLLNMESGKEYKYDGIENIDWSKVKLSPIKETDTETDTETDDQFRIQ